VSISSVIRVALIGCGRIAGHHCRSIKNTRGAELVAVCDLVSTKAEAYGNEFSVPWYIDYRLMLTRHPEINVVAVISPSGMHFEHVSEIISIYNKNVIVEKPTFMKVTHARQAFTLANINNVNIFPVFQNRYNRAVSRVRQALLDGELGKVRIVSARVRWCRPQRYYDLAPWRGTFAMDGGALTNQGIHHIDLLRHLGGRVVQVCSSMKTLGASIEVEDAGVGILEYASGAIGNLEITTSARPDDFEASISFVCENGLAQIGGIAVNELQVFTPEPTACFANSEDFSGNVYGHGHSHIYHDIVEFFTKGTQYPVDEDDCLSTLQLLHSLYRSDEQKTWVQVDSSMDSDRLGRPDELLANLYRTPNIES
jgi:predicted dehydrogenase